MLRTQPSIWRPDTPVYHGLIRSSENLLVFVLDNSDRGNDFQVDVAINYLQKQRGVQRKQKMFGPRRAVATRERHGLPSVLRGAPPVVWIGVFCGRCGRCQGLRKLFGAATIHAQARRGHVVGSAWPINHALQHFSTQGWAGALFWDLRADKLVVRMCRLRHILPAQDDQPVSVRQATLLELKGHHECQTIAKHFVLLDRFDQLFQLHFENASDQIWAIAWSLVRQQRILNLLPLRIAGQCSKESWLSKGKYNIHGVGKVLGHVPRARNMRCVQEDSFSDPPRCGRAIPDRVHHATKHFAPQAVRV